MRFDDYFDHDMFLYDVLVVADNVDDVSYVRYYLNHHLMMNVFHVLDLSIDVNF